MELNLELENKEVSSINNIGVIAAIASCFYFFTTFIIIIAIMMGANLFSSVNEIKPILIITTIVILGVAFYFSIKKQDIKSLLLLVTVLSGLITFLVFFVILYFDLHNMYLLII